MTDLTGPNTSKADVFPASVNDRAVAVAIVMAVRRGDEAALDEVLARPRAHVPLIAGSPLHLLGVWHAATVALRFLDRTSASPAFLKHLAGTARLMTAVKQSVSDERVGDLLRFWLQAPAGAGRSSVAPTDQELTALAASLVRMLPSAQTTETGVRGFIDEVADSITVSTETGFGTFGAVKRDWTEGAATMVTLTRDRRHSGKFVDDRYAGAAERAGLLIDIAFHLRTPVLDPPSGTGTGTDGIDFEPARHLLQAMTEQPGHTLEYWIGKGPTLAEDLAEQWATRHLPTGAAPADKWRRAFVDKDTHERQAHDIQQLFADVAANPSTDPYENVIAVVLGTTGKTWTGSYRSSPELLLSCGPVADLAFRIQEFIVDARLHPPISLTR